MLGLRLTISGLLSLLVVIVLVMYYYYCYYYYMFVILILPCALAPGRSRKARLLGACWPKGAGRSGRSEGIGRGERGAGRGGESRALSPLILHSAHAAESPVNAWPLFNSPAGGSGHEGGGLWGLVKVTRIRLFCLFSSGARGLAGDQRAPCPARIRGTDGETATRPAAAFPFGGQARRPLEKSPQFHFSFRFT